MASVVVFDTARSALQDLAARARSRAAIHKVAAVAATQLVRDHFAINATENRNPYGAPSRFWARMSRGTRAEANAKEAAVVMPREVAQRYYGGPIRPTGGRKFLAIPANRTAYGRSPRSFADLVFIVIQGRPALARITKVQTYHTLTHHDAASDRRKDGRVRTKRVKAGKLDKPTVMFWLVRGVVQKGNPGVLPPMQSIYAAAERAMSSYLVDQLDERDQSRGTGEDTAAT